MRCFQSFMEKLCIRSSRVPEIVIADAGYTSELNYLYALGEENQDKAEDPRFQFVAPYNTYRKEKKRSFKHESEKCEELGVRRSGRCFYLSEQPTCGI